MKFFFSFSQYFRDKITSAVQFIVYTMFVPKKFEKKKKNQNAREASAQTICNDT